MPVLDIDFSQVKMASIAPKVEPTLAVKRTSLAPTEVNPSPDKHFAQQQPLKKRRLLPFSCSAINSTPSAQTEPYKPPEAEESNDLTNLNWLQDANLLKSVYSDALDLNKSNGPSSTPESATESADGAHLVIPGPMLTAARRAIPVKSTHRKPAYSYSALIFMAIESSPSKSMMVRDIYSWIVDNFPYFATAPSGWKNTIRHTLSLRKCFKKVDRGTGSGQSDTSGDNDSDSGDIKGGYWHVDGDYRPSLVQLVERTQQNMLPKLMVRKQIGAPKQVCAWDLGRLWPSGLSQLDHSLAAAASRNKCQEKSQFVAFSGQRFIQVPVIRSFPRYRGKPLAQQTCAHNGATPLWAQKTAWEQAAEASYKLQLTIDKFCPTLMDSNSSRSIHGASHSPRRTRNSVSVISVNQTPKVYAPVPKVANEKAHILPFESHLERAQSFAGANPTRNVPLAKDHTKPTDSERQHKLSLDHCPHIVFPSQVTTNGTVNEQNGGLCSNVPLRSDDDEDDVLIRDGAQALLNFASGAFQLNRLIKQED